MLLQVVSFSRDVGHHELSRRDLDSTDFTDLHKPNQSNDRTQERMSAKAQADGLFRESMVSKRVVRRDREEGELERTAELGFLGFAVKTLTQTPFF